MGIIPRKKIATKTTTGLTVAAALITAASVTSASLAVGLFAAVPLLKQQMVHMADLLDTCAWDCAPPVVREIPPLNVIQEEDLYTYEKVEGGSNGEAFDLQLTPDGGYILAGSIQMNPETNINQPYLLKIWGDNAPTPGDLLEKEWSVILPADFGGIGRSVALAYDRQGAGQVLEAYVIAGVITADSGKLNAFVTKVPPGGGSPIFNREYGDADASEIAHSVVQVFDASGRKDGFVLAGFQSKTGNKIWLARTDDNGNLSAVWPENPKLLSLGDVGKDYAYAIRQTFDVSGVPDGFIIAGETARTAFNTEALLVKLTPSGALDGTAWPQTATQPAGYRMFGGNSTESGRDVEIKYDLAGKPAGYILGGLARSFNRFNPGRAAPYLVVVDRNGQMLLEAHDYIATDSPMYSVEQTFTPDGLPNGYVLAGKYIFSFTYDAFLVRTDSKTTQKWTSLDGGNLVEVANVVKQTRNGGFILAGKTHSLLYIDPPEIRPSNLYVVLRGPDLTPLPPEDPTPTVAQFRRGDTDTNGKPAITDSIYTLTWMFLAGPKPICLDAADSNDDGQINLTDPVHTLNYLFLGGSIPPPGPITPGPDPTDDPLDCATYPAP